MTTQIAALSAHNSQLTVSSYTNTSVATERTTKASHEADIMYMKTTNSIPVAANTLLAKQVTDADIDALCISFGILSLSNEGVAPMQVDDPVIEDLCASFQSLTVFEDDSMEIDDPMDWEPLQDPPTPMDWEPLKELPIPMDWEYTCHGMDWTAI